ncbi:hypothetical protein CVT24_003801 [Panaeolus cyanescens]|uniref:cutinase n=1 Tax=Panaeolus cyanescens TaxID=181874 RepID=A0A409VUU9_9AGAR|nr:hypothetical protein CVT24_003801 [Panaeolus cyanescens]
MIMLRTKRSVGAWLWVPADLFKRISRLPASVVWLILSTFVFKEFELFRIQCSPALSTSSSSLAIGSSLAAPTDIAGTVELETRQSCPDVAVYFARGTTESGTLGTIVGPPFRTALTSALRGKSLQFNGVSYPATVGGYLAGGDVGGATTMANSVTSIAGSCPNTKIVISGYRLSSSVQNRVVAVVTFGDPYRDRSLPFNHAARHSAPLVILFVKVDRSFWHPISPMALTLERLRHLLQVAFKQL